MEIGRMDEWRRDAESWHPRSHVRYLHIRTYGSRTSLPHRFGTASPNFSKFSRNMLGELLRLHVVRGRVLPRVARVAEPRRERPRTSRRNRQARRSDRRPVGTSRGSRAGCRAPSRACGRASSACRRRRRRRVQPVLTQPHVRVVLVDQLAEHLARTSSGATRGRPRRSTSENVACGSVTPRSVPATFAV